VFEAPWGEDIDLYKGGYIVREYIDGEARYYGVNKEEFEATYTVSKQENTQELMRGAESIVKKQADKHQEIKRGSSFDFKNN
tara:strand:- start:228 stop:473 length:246 start_codon:yes stop_codon:yes gene_type:complete